MPGGIGLREHPTKQRDDLGELPRDGEKQQNHDEQIGELSHQMSLGTSRGPRVLFTQGRSALRAILRSLAIVHQCRFDVSGGQLAQH